MFSEHLLSLTVFFPVLGALLITFIARNNKSLGSYIAVATALITFALSLIVFFNFEPSNTGVQFLEKFEWVKTLNISYQLAVDGISVNFIPITALVFLLCVVASLGKTCFHICDEPGFLSLFLLLETTILGTFLAADLFMFFTFWGVSLLPVYFILGVWGGKQREYAANKFFIYQLVGVGALLLGALFIYYNQVPHNFDILTLSGGKYVGLKYSLGEYSFETNKVVFLLMMFGFAVRMGIVPFHTWFVHAQSEAPSVLTVVLAALFIKMGAYGIVRINYGIFPVAAAWAAPVVAILGVVNIIYGGLCALAQKDMRKIIAYCGISHMGFVLLGLGVLSPSGFSGAMLQMASNAFYIALLFFLVGFLGRHGGSFLLEKENGSQNYGALFSRAPVLTGFFTVAVFSALGIPGLGVFSSGALVILGAFPVYLGLTILALLGIFISAGYLLGLYKDLFWGKSGDESDSIKDVSLLDQVYLMPLAMLCVFVGSYPAPFIEKAQPTIEYFLQTIMSVTGAGK